MNMKKIDELASYKRMIEEGKLITAQEAELQYGLTREQVEEAARYGDLETVRFTKKDYFVAWQVGLLRDAIREQEDAEE